MHLQWTPNSLKRRRFHYLSEYRCTGYDTVLFCYTRVMNTGNLFAILSIMCLSTI